MKRGNVIGKMRNNWRQRNVTVYEDLDASHMVITVGEPFDGSKPVECHEHRSEWKTTLSCFPRTYVFN